MLTPFLSLEMEEGERLASNILYAMLEARGVQKRS